MDKDKRKKSVKDSMKSRIAAINRSIAPSKSIADEIKKLSGGTGGKTVSGLDKSMINIAYALANKMQGGSGGRTISDKDFMAALKKIRDAKKKGKPHLKHGGKAKKKYGVVGKPTLKKGGKV